MKRIALPQGRSNFEIVTTLEGEQYRFVFLWNARSSKWYVTIFDSTGTQLQGNTKFVVNYPLTSLNTLENLFPGVLWAIDTSGNWNDAELRDIGNRVSFLYEESTE
jgi:hypothetical protein